MFYGALTIGWHLTRGEHIGLDGIIQDGGVLNVGVECLKRETIGGAVRCFWDGDFRGGGH
jgi:hypothetical protein